METKSREVEGRKSSREGSRFAEGNIFYLAKECHFCTSTPCPLIQCGSKGWHKRYLSLRTLKYNLRVKTSLQRNAS